MKINHVTDSNIKNVDFNQLDFGKTFSDYMMAMDYDGHSWSEYSIEPLKALSFHPAMSVFHYGQAVFEGLKAFKLENGDVNIFRSHDNIERFNKSAERLLMPQIDKQQANEALAGKALQHRALFYHATYVNPSWSSKMIPIGRIGKHIFYVEK